MPNTSVKQLKRNRRHVKIRAKLRGTAARPRLVVFRSLKHNFAQIVDDDKGVILAQASDLKTKKGNGIERAKKVGEEIAKAAVAKKIETCVFDRNGFLYHGRIQAMADSARANGLNI